MKLSLSEWMTTLPALQVFGQCVGLQSPGWPFVQVEAKPRAYMKIHALGLMHNLVQRH
jgi:hypothetical protein